MGLTPYIIGLGGRAQAGKSYISSELFDQLRTVAGPPHVVRMKFAAPLKRLTKLVICEATGIHQDDELERYVEGDLKEERLPFPIHLGPEGVADYTIGYFRQLAGENDLGRNGTRRLTAKLESQEPRLATPRALMQYLGTECGRDCYGPDFWVDQAFKRYEWWEQTRKMQGMPSPKYLIFDDMRFASERHGIRVYAAKNGFKSLLVAIARDNLDTLFGDIDGGHASENSYGHAIDYNLCYAIASGDLDGLKDVATCIVDYINE